MEKELVKPTDAQIAEINKGNGAGTSATFPKEIYSRDLMAKVGYNILDNFIPTFLYDNPDPIVQLEGQKGLAIYADMMLHPVVSACWNLIVNTITGMDWDIIAASSDPEDIRRRDHIDDSYHRMNSSLWQGNAYYGGFSAFEVAQLDALRMGYSIPQAIWNLSEGRIATVLHEIPQAFSFYEEGVGAFSFNSFWTGTKLHYRSEPNAKPIPAPPYKFMHFIYNQEYGAPQGKSILRPAYWPYVFGFLEGTKMWVNFLDTWGSPAILGLIDREDWEDEALRNALINVINNFQRGYRATLPRSRTGNSPMEIVESNRSSSHTVFSDFYQTMNRLIASSIVGSPLVMLEAEFGTRAQAQVQNESVFLNFVKGWADWFMAQQQIPIQWQTDMKFGKSGDRYVYDSTTGRTMVEKRARYSTFKLKYEPPVDLKNDTSVDKALIEMGAEIPMTYLYDKYGRPQARMIEKTDPVTGVKTTVKEPIATLVAVPNSYAAASASSNHEISTGKFQINDNLKNMTGRQQQQFLRVIRQFGQGKMTQEQATILLRQGYGFSEEEIKAILGVDEEIVKPQDIKAPPKDAGGELQPPAEKLPPRQP